MALRKARLVVKTNGWPEQPKECWEFNFSLSSGPDSRMTVLNRTLTQALDAAENLLAVEFPNTLRRDFTLRFECETLPGSEEFAVVPESVPAIERWYEKFDWPRAVPYVKAGAVSGFWDVRGGREMTKEEATGWVTEQLLAGGKS
jgi:hypothetical protein